MIIDNKNICTVTNQNPFPGIRSYEQSEADLFFGREAHINELSQRIKETHFIAIVGSSGCGKSSLIKAGLIPYLITEKSSISGPWTHVLFRPGDTPIRNLSLAIHKSLIRYRDKKILTVEEIEEILRSDVNGIINLIKKINLDNFKNRLFVIDQFEEIIRFNQNKPSSKVDEATHFINLFLEAIKASDLPIYVVLTMRSDFIDYCTDFHGLPEAVNLGYYLVPRMTEDEIKRVIVGPIEKCGGTISEHLITRVLQDIGNSPDQMPILQHALMRTWDYWKLHATSGQSIDISHYEAVGSINHALSIHAEEVFNELPTNRTKVIAEKVFKALTDISKDGKGTRRPTPLKELVNLSAADQDDVIEVIERFRKAGRAFLMPPPRESLTPDTIIDISHESIMRIWERLRKWVEDETKSAQLYLRLTRSAAMYQEGRAGLWKNPELQLGLNWFKNAKPNEAWAQRYDTTFDRAIEFLEASKKAHDQEIANKENQQKRRLERVKGLAIVMTFAFLISIFMAIVSLSLKFQAQESEANAREKEQIATVERKNAEKQRKEALAQKKIAEQQQQIAEQQKIITEQQRLEAIKQKNSADVAKNVAIVAKNDAEEQRQEAVNQKQIAEQQRVKAENSESNAQRLRLLAIARSIAVQSSKMNVTTQGDLPALLALQAYNLNEDNDGVKNDPDIFNALSSVTDDKIILRNHQDAIRCIAIENNKMYSADNFSTLNIWELKTGKLLNTLLPDKKSIDGFRSIDVKDNIIIASITDGTIYVWKDEQLYKTVKIHNSYLPVIKILNNKSFLSCDVHGNFQIYDFEKDYIAENIAENKNISSMNFNENMLFYSTLDGKVFSLDINNLESSPNHLLSSSNDITCINRSNNLVVIGLKNGVIELWNNQEDQFKLQARLIGHKSEITDLVFSPDKNTLASTSYDKTVRLWKYHNSNEQPIVLQHHDSWVYKSLFTPDGSAIITASEDRALVIRTIDTDMLASRICDQVNRNLTQQEWIKYIGKDIDYEKTCPEIE